MLEKLVPALRDQEDVVEDDETLARRLGVTVDQLDDIQTVSGEHRRRIRRAEIRATAKRKTRGQRLWNRQQRFAPARLPQGGFMATQAGNMIRRDNREPVELSGSALVKQRRALRREAEAVAHMVRETGLSPSDAHDALKLSGDPAIVKRSA